MVMIQAVRSEQMTHFLGVQKTCVFLVRLVDKSNVEVGFVGEQGLYTAYARSCIWNFSYAGIWDSEDP